MDVKKPPVDEALNREEKGRTMNKILLRVLVIVPLILGLAGMSPAFAQSIGNDWIRKTFDFGSEDINFETIVPPGAKVETTELGSSDPGTIGKIKIIGKIYPADGDYPVEVTIKAFDLAAPASASRVCVYEIESAGYTPRSLNSAPDLSDARIFATKSNRSRPMEGAFSQCLMRGNKMLALHFTFDVSSAENVEAADVLVTKAQDYANMILSNITFADGKPVGYGDGMKDVPVTIAAEKLTLSVPVLWKVAINDFRGPLPAELHLLRQSSEGKSTGAIWLFVQDRKEQPDLEELGQALIRDYLVQQLPNAKPPVMLASGEEPVFTKAGVAGRNFRFSVKSKSEEDMGDILATLIWHDGRLYVFSLWSAWNTTGDSNNFYSRLPGLTAYDLISVALTRTIIGQR